MIVGFTITDYNGYEQETLEFLREVCVVNQKGVLEALVASGPGVNIFPTQRLTEEILDAQPFSYTAITTIEGFRLIISKVSFVCEVPMGDGVQRIKPAEYIYVKNSENYNTFISRGFLELVGQSLWLLYNGIWNDCDYWDDGIVLYFDGLKLLTDGSLHLSTFGLKLLS